MPVEEKFIDVSPLEAPEPMQKVLQLLAGLSYGQYLRVLHRKQPLPLIQLLQEQGYGVSSTSYGEEHWEIIIWHQDDPFVTHYCQQQFPAHFSES